MRTRAMSRRTVLEAGVCAMAATAAIPGAAGAHAETGLSPKKEETIRKYYAAWEQRDWHPIDILLADNFTFSSANNDDHISKSTFKARCWQSQIDFIERFELERDRDRLHLRRARHLQEVQGPGARRGGGAVRAGRPCVKRRREAGGKGESRESVEIAAGKSIHRIWPRLCRQQA